MNQDITAIAAHRLILSCSPRPQGNCDHAARIFEEEHNFQAPGQASLMRTLRKFRIKGCTGCGACTVWAKSYRKNEDEAPILPEAEKAFLGCPLSLEDDSRMLLQEIAFAKDLCIIAPIYFYHLPSQLKALLDRIQPFWAIRQEGVDFFRKDRSCKVILLGARQTGDSLFKGSILTLKFSLGQMRYQLYNPLLLYGLDSPKDLLENKEPIHRIKNYAAEKPEAASFKP